MTARRSGLLFLVDDDPLLSDLLAETLRGEGFAVSTFESGESCLQAMQEAVPNCVLLDLQMPGLGGQATLERITKLHRHLPVIVLTMDRDVSTVVNVIKQGAYDFLPKPVESSKLITTVANAVEKHTLSLRVAQLERQHETHGFPGLVGSSPRMQALVREIERVAATDITIHVHGESGTGKELIARAVHENSGRRDKAFVALNCAALTESIQESELFGHEKGAFTGAVARKEGRFEAVNGGTLFLDEVAELSLGTQAKLLRVLQERKIQRVGGLQEVPVDFRLLTATHRDLAEAVRKGTFREDLYFRIVVYELEVPPLRERDADLVVLAEHFVNLHGPRLINKRPRLSPGALASLLQHTWPGNVRELENAVQRALVSCDGETILPGDLPRRTTESTAAPAPSAVTTAPSTAPAATLPPLAAPELPREVASTAPVPPPASAAAATLEEAERAQIVAALERCRGNRSLAARQLGIGRTTLYRKLKDYGLEAP